MASPDRTRPPSRSDLLARDAAALARLAALLDTNPRACDAVQAAFPDDWHARDLGFGASAATSGEAAGTLTIRLDVTAHDGRLALWTAGVYWPGEPAADQRAVLRAALGERMEPRSTSAVLASRDEAVLAALHAARIAALGEPPALVVPPALRGPVDLLTELGSLIVGERCGFAGQPTPGHAALTTILGVRRPDLLAIPLRGANVGGRVFAARGLLRSGAVTDDDRRVIALLRGMKTPVTACTGCTHWGTTTADLLAE